MTEILLAVRHNLESSEVQSRLTGMLDKMQRQGHVSDVRQRWVEETGLFEFKARGFTVSGRLRILDDRVILKGTLPMAAAPFKSLIEQTIRQHARLALDLEPKR